MTGKPNSDLMALHAEKPLPSAKDTSSNTRSALSSASTAIAADCPDTLRTIYPAPFRYSVRLATIVLSSSTKSIFIIIEPPKISL